MPKTSKKKYHFILKEFEAFVRDYPRSAEVLVMDSRDAPEAKSDGLVKKE